MKAEEFDKKFDAGEDVTKYLDTSRARRPGQEQKRVNVDFPAWMVRLLDKDARRWASPAGHHKGMDGERLEKTG